MSVFLLIIGIILICTYVKTPVSISPASCGCLDQFYVNRHKIIDVHPASSVSSGLSVKRTLGVVDDLITEQRHQLALCPSGSLSRSIHSTRADDCTLETIAVIHCCLLDNFLDVPMQRCVR